MFTPVYPQSVELGTNSMDKLMAYREGRKNAWNGFGQKNR